MPSLADGSDNDSGSVTPLKYAVNRNSRIPSVTDLTGLRGPISSTAAAKEKPHRSTTATKEKPLRRTAHAAYKIKPTRSTAPVASKNKPTRSTAAAEKNRPLYHAATVHCSADLLTSTVISMPDAIENENYLGIVDAIEAVV